MGFFISMTILSVKPTYFRNLAPDEIVLSEGINLVVGKNGSGKTSLLEAIYMLTSGRSFRTRKLETIIFRNEDTSSHETFLFGRVRQSESSVNTTHEIGVRKSKVDKALIKIDGQSVLSSSVLAAICPISVIEPDNLSLLSGAPQQRRKFVDWGVFHVEPSYSKLWKNYVVTLKQRNAMLKTMSPYGPTDQLDVWDEQLSRHAEKIDYLRSKVLEVLQEHFSKLLKNLLPGIAVSLSYRRGWDQSAGLGTALKKNRDTDISRSFTSVGAHRMDVRIGVSNKAAIEVLSRGQLKLVTMALYLAQVKALFLMTGKKSVVMVDDVSAELDSANTSRVFATLDEVGSQIICTTLDLEQTIKSINTSREVRVFHVEQGHIQEDKTSIQSLSNTDTE